MNKIRVSAFGNEVKWLSSFAGGSMLVVEDPFIIPLQSKYLQNGVTVKYELRLRKESNVVVELDNSYVHSWYVKY